MTRALAMISGGLDSILAAKLMKDQGIDVIGVCFKSHFFDEESAVKMTKQIDIPLKVVDFSEKHLEVVKNPKYGYGKNMNPCIDCHSLMMNYSGKLLNELEADFIITGEVLNQRPMSQNKVSLELVQNYSGYADKILRPLCAKNLPPTKMELEGIVNRENLLDISGRSRKIQMALADKWGIKEYPSPAGGCKLTEPNYSDRLRDLLKYNNEPEDRELDILRIGRHFRMTPKAKIISTRTKIEGEEVKQYLKKEDLVFMCKEFNGSMIIIIGEPSKEDIELAARISGRYSKGKDEEKVKIIYGNYTKPYNNEIEVTPAKDDDIKEYII